MQPGLPRRRRAWLDSQLQTERAQVERAATAHHRPVAHGPAGAGVVGDLPVQRDGQLRHHVLPAADHQALGHSNLVTGLLTAIPYTVGVVGLLLWGHSSDRRKERRRQPDSRTRAVRARIHLAGLGRHVVLGAGRDCRSLQSAVYGSRRRSGRCRRCSSPELRRQAGLR